MCTSGNALRLSSQGHQEVFPFCFPSRVKLPVLTAPLSWSDACPVPALTCWGKKVTLKIWSQLPNELKYVSADAQYSKRPKHVRVYMCLSALLSLWDSHSTEDIYRWNAFPVLKVILPDRFLFKGEVNVARRLGSRVGVGWGFSACFQAWHGVDLLGGSTCPTRPWRNCSHDQGQCGRNKSSRKQTTVLTNITLKSYWDIICDGKICIFKVPRFMF